VLLAGPVWWLSFGCWTHGATRVFTVAGRGVRVLRRSGLVLAARFSVSLPVRAALLSPAELLRRTTACINKQRQQTCGTCSRDNSAANERAFGHASQHHDFSLGTRTTEGRGRWQAKQNGARKKPRRCRPVEICSAELNAALRSSRRYGLRAYAPSPFRENCSCARVLGRQWIRPRR
jgi:hypothetical protein